MGRTIEIPDAKMFFLRAKHWENGELVIEQYEDARLAKKWQDMIDSGQITHMAAFVHAPQFDQHGSIAYIGGHGSISVDYKHANGQNLPPELCRMAFEILLKETQKL